MEWAALGIVWSPDPPPEANVQPGSGTASSLNLTDLACLWTKAAVTYWGRPGWHSWSFGIQMALKLLIKAAQLGSGLVGVIN